MSILLADIDATCAALGYNDGSRYIAEPDALQGLKHLIWILRRDLDNHEYRRHLGRAKVLQTDLLYMLPEFIKDDEFSDVLIRLLVILTNPALLLYRDGPPKDNHGCRVYMELIDLLQDYKAAFARNTIWSSLYIKLQKALEVDWALRSEEQSLLIERILVLMRNVLQVPANPEAECRTDNDASVHDRIIWALHQSGMLDLLLFIISSPDEHQFHLHGLEILCLLYREQTAESLADASLQRNNREKQHDEQELLAVRRREKQRHLMRPPPARHSRFGGTYVIRNMKSVSDRDIICHQPLERVVAMDFDREKQKQKPSFRHVKEEIQITRRSAFSVRMCLREYCIEVLRSAYNTFVRQVRRVLERNSGMTSNDDSYLLWAIRFFMEFNSLSGLQLELVSESLSVQCFHWVLTRMQHDMDMIVSDKKQSRIWAKRLHIALQTFRELLQSLLALQKLRDDNAQALFDMLLNNVCYVLEYRETILHLLMNYNEAHSTKVFLRDVVETAHIFIKMMEKFCKDSVLVQDKKRQTKKRTKKPNSKAVTKTMEQLQEELADKWAVIAAEVSKCLESNIELPEEQQPLPFDAASEKNIEDQKDDCMIRIHKLLHEQKIPAAIALFHAAREVWPENDVFGSMSAAAEDDFLLLREICIHNITTVDNSSEPAEQELYEEQHDEEEDEFEDNGLVEKTFKFDDFTKRLLNGKIVRACTVVLSDWQQIPTRSLKAAVTILHRIAYGCSCPAMLYQAKLFRIFQEVLHAPRDAHQEELRRLGLYVVRKFIETAPSNPKIYAELLFYKSIKEANELETGYCEEYETGTKSAWTEEQETELRLLFEENQRNPATDKDVIDWILDNLIDKTRTRRGVLKKLKELELLFKAPTKKSTAAGANKNHWRPEEDEELRSLYDQYRLEEDCLQRILSEFEDRRNKQQIIKRMLQLHMIADKSEILPAKPAKRRTKKKTTNQNDMDEYMEEEPTFGVEMSKTSKSKQKKLRVKKSTKPVKRNIVRTALDVGTIRALMAQVDEEKYQPAIDWLKECLEEAAEDTEEISEEDDGVPLLPLLDVQKEAMEDANFKKLLIALGIQPPIADVEHYWRMPIYLNQADLLFRAKIIAGEDLSVHINDLEQEQNNNNDEEASAAESSSSSEHDMEERERAKLRLLMYTQSDEETEQRAPLPAKKEKQMLKKKIRLSDESEDEMESVKLIEKKLHKKKRQPDLSSSDDDEHQLDIAAAQRSAFDQLKAKRANKENLQQKKGKKLNTSTKESGSDLDVSLIEKKLQRKLRQSNALSSEEEAEEEINLVFDENKQMEIDEELDFNSQDYRKRLLELEQYDLDLEENSIKTANISSGKAAKRATLIDSDSDDTTSNQAANNKRQRSPTASVNVASDSDSANEQQHNNTVSPAAGMRRFSGKRRRLAVIDDDDDDDDNIDAGRLGVGVDEQHD